MQTKLIDDTGPSTAAANPAIWITMLPSPSHTPMRDAIASRRCALKEVRAVQANALGRQRSQTHIDQAHTVDDEQVLLSGLKRRAACEPLAPTVPDGAMERVFRVLADDEVAALVCDSGTDTVKAGLDGDDLPRAIFPSVIGRPHQPGALAPGW